MNESNIAVRYSKALFETAKEKDSLSEVRDDMLFILELSRLDDFRDLVDSPVISKSKKGSIMEAVCRDKVSDITFSLITLTIKNNREASLPGIARSYIKRADKHEGLTRVTLKTAVPINEENRKLIISILEDDMKKKADLQEEVDSEIGGGYILKVEDLYFDASLRSQLRRIKKELIKG